jgi:RNA polymerase sigma-54 factor
MALTPRLEVRQSQSLTLTPQLMQSIRLLQLSHLELNSFVEAELLRNPLLEHENADASSAEREDSGDPLNSDAGQATDDWFREAGADGGEGLAEHLGPAYANLYQDDASPAKPDVVELVGQWKSMPGAGAMTSGESLDFDAFAVQTETLRSHVEQQIAFAGLGLRERAIAVDLADHLDEAGYLRCDTGSATARLGCTISEIDQVLGRLQAFDPPGLFARSLSECLAIQLRQRDRFDPAMQALVAHLDLLAKRDFAALRRLCGVDEEDLVDMLAEIRTLDPKPGHRFDPAPVQSVVADVIVTPSPDGGWNVELNPETLPKVLVNHGYYAEVSRRASSDPDDRTFLVNCLQSANWLTRSLDQRARTILKVAGEIVRQQDQFLVKGVDHLRPLNLKAVAEAIGMHESTVSRVTSNKYMLTPRGVFELKYFFTVSIASAEGGDAHSAEAVRHRIRALITAEEPDAVLSDDAIVETLKQSGVDIARRTVAKYRESMNIPSSVQRRREKRALARSAAL